jgi:hypothetical protein
LFAKKIATFATKKIQQAKITAVRYAGDRKSALLLNAIKVSG